MVRYQCQRCCLDNDGFSREPKAAEASSTGLDSADTPGSVRLLADRALMLVQRRHATDLPAENVLLEIAPQRLHLVLGVDTRWDRED